MNTLEKIKKYFVVGILLLLPLCITLYILKILGGLLSSFLGLIHRNFYFLAILPIPQSEVITIIILILLLGYVIKKLHLENVIFNFEKKIIQKIPLIKTIYSGIKKITNLIKQTQSNTNQAELIAWVKLPKLNVYCIGFYVGELEPEYAPEKEKKYFSFFIPTTPNPVTGYYIIAAEGEFVFNQMSREEALSLVVSGGIIRPEKN